MLRLFVPAILCAFALFVSAPLVAAEPVCGGERFAIETRPGGASPYIDLTLEGRTGPFLLDYAATASGLERGVWPFAEDQNTVQRRGLTLPSWRDQDIVYEIHDRDVKVGAREQHGVIGVDLLQGQVLEFNYEMPGDYSVSIGAFGARCGADLAAQGFMRVGQGRYWVNGGASEVQPANVPVIYFDLARWGALDTPIGIDAWAQIDTGYDDSVHLYSIDINQPLYDRLIAAGVRLTEIEQASVTDCARVVQQRRAFRAPDMALRLETDTGELIALVEGVTFILKRDSAACGGIGADPRPGAQVGASFLRVFGVTVFSGPTKEVWVGPSRLRPQ